MNAPLGQAEAEPHAAPPNTWLRYVSKSMTRPLSCAASSLATLHFARVAVDLHLREVGDKRADDHRQQPRARRTTSRIGLGLRNDLTYSRGFRGMGSHVFQGRREHRFRLNTGFDQGQRRHAGASTTTRRRTIRRTTMRRPISSSTVVAIRTSTRTTTEIGAYIQDDLVADLAFDVQPGHSVGHGVPHDELRLRHAEERSRHADTL